MALEGSLLIPHSSLRGLTEGHGLEDAEVTQTRRDAVLQAPARLCLALPPSLAQDMRSMGRESHDQGGCVLVTWDKGHAHAGAGGGVGAPLWLEAHPHSAPVGSACAATVSSKFKCRRPSPRTSKRSCIWRWDFKEAAKLTTGRRVASSSAIGCL